MFKSILLFSGTRPVDSWTKVKTPGVVVQREHNIMNI